MVGKKGIASANQSNDTPTGLSSIRNKRERVIPGVTGTNQPNDTPTS